MEKEVNRRRLLTGVGAVATTAIAGCTGDGNGDGNGNGNGNGGSGNGNGNGGSGNGNGNGNGSSESMDGGELQLMQGPLETLDPIAVQGPRDSWVTFMLHESLFEYEDGTLPPVGSLAVDYNISDDNLTYTFELKEGVTFHDGSELTASDVVYSWRRLAESPNNRNSENFIVGNIMNVAHDETEDGEIVPDSMALEAVDDRTVEMTLATPFHGVIGHLTDTILSIIPEGVVGDIEGYEGEFEYEEWLSSEATGSGPFQLEAWNEGSEVQLSRFDDYHGSVANIDGVRSQIVGDPNARYTRAVNEQNADIFDVPRSQFDPQQLTVEETLDDGRDIGTYGPVNGTTLNYGATSLPTTQYLIFHTLNVEKPVRQAMAYAVNQQVVAEQVTKGLGEPAYFLTPPSAFPGGSENYTQVAESDYPYGYNSSLIEEARSIMEDAGYGPNNMSETSIMYPSDDQASQWESLAQLLRDLSQSIHINLSLESAPASTLTNRAIDGNFDIFATFNSLTWIEADATLQYAYPNPYTWTRWGQGEGEMSPTAQEAADAWSKYSDNQAPTEEAQQARNEAYLTLEKANWEDMTELPLWHPTDQTYWYDWVEGYRANGPMRRPKFNEVSLNERS